MRLEVQRSGGILGRAVSWSVDVDALEPDCRAEVHDLLRQVQVSQREQPPGADRFSYRVVADRRGTEPLDLRLREPLPEPAQRLLELVRDSPLSDDAPPGD